MLDAVAADWVIAQVPRGRRVVNAQRLTGGLTSEVTGVSVEAADGKSHRFVLRRWTGQPWPDGTVDDGRALVPREAAVLSALESTHIVVPTVVAVDPDGSSAGLPALLMTRLPGRIELTPAEPADWTRRLAEQLAEIHGIPPWPGLPAYDSWIDLDVGVPEWSTRPQLWQAALDLVHDRPPLDPGGFVHHDYQQFNVLWSRGRISGVVDWVWASRGRSDVDVMHCRLDLCLLYGADRAIAFQLAYEALTGRRVSPWWDAAGVVDYLGRWTAEDLQKQAGRRLRIDADALPRRVEALLEWVVRRR